MDTLPLLGQSFLPLPQRQVNIAARRVARRLLILAYAFSLCLRFERISPSFTLAGSTAKPLSVWRSVPRLAAGDEPSDVSSWRVRELKDFLNKRGIGHADCFEKTELVDRVRSAQQSDAPSAATVSAASAPPQTGVPEYLQSAALEGTLVGTWFYDGNKYNIKKDDVGRLVYLETSPDGKMVLEGQLAQVTEDGADWMVASLSVGSIRLRYDNGVILSQLKVTDQTFWGDVVTAKSQAQGTGAAAVDVIPEPSGVLTGDLKRGDFTEDQLAAMRATELKAVILKAGGSVDGCIFKEDFLKRASQILLQGGSKPGQDAGKKSYE